MDRHILVVEDSPTQSLLVSRVLENAGFQVCAASDGLAALTHLSTNSPRLVISDVSMPGMDGYQLCRAMRADKKLEKIPVLLLTNLADEEKVLAGLEACHRARDRWARWVRGARKGLHQGRDAG